MNMTGIISEAAIKFGELRGAPSIQARNIDAIAAHYSGHRPNPRVVSIGHRLGNLIYRPLVSMSPEARTSLDEHMADDGVVILASNHVRWMDPLVIAASLYHTDELVPVAHNMIIPTKPSLFKVPGLRWAIEGMGSYPTFREKDVAESGADGTPVVSADNKKYLKKAGEYTVATAVNNLVEGGNVAAFVEGTRNKGNPLVVQETERGAVAMLEAASRAGANVAMLDFGIYYANDSSGQPIVSVGGVFKPEGKNFRQKAEDVREHIQSRVTEAAEL